MGLFTRKQRLPETTADPPILGPGRTVTSALDLDGCLRALDQTLMSFRVPEYTHLPTFTKASWAWTGEPALAPAIVVICADLPGDHLLVALWPDGGGTRIGLVPLGGEDQQAGDMESAMLAAWRQRDSSLARMAGDLGAGLLRLVAPLLPAGYAEEIVAAAGYRPTRPNTQIITRIARGLLLGWTQLFIDQREPRAARRFVRRHSLRQPVNDADLQQIIDDLARVDPGLLPYLQWLPVRTRALMLEFSQDPNSFWGDLDR
jgi:hypothetical protein